ncbi:hypothetical protein MRB53_041925 [Persea americana]|nr:hypothetical protein MRB53_041925 [Persea americana]
MYARGDTSNVTIPSLFTSHTTAHLLSSLIPSRGAIGDLDGRLSTRRGFRRQGQEPARKRTGTDQALLNPNSAVRKRAQTLPRTKQDDFQCLAMRGSRAGRMSTWLKYMLGESSSWADTRRPPSSGDVEWLSGGRSQWESCATRTKSKRVGPRR